MVISAVRRVLAELFLPYGGRQEIGRLRREFFRPPGHARPLPYPGKGAAPVQAGSVLPGLLPDACVVSQLLADLEPLPVGLDPAGQQRPRAYQRFVTEPDTVPAEGNQPGPRQPVERACRRLLIGQPAQQRTALQLADRVGSLITDPYQTGAASAGRNPALPPTVRHRFRPRSSRWPR